MKAFFEEYGFVLVSVAVIAVLIAIVSNSSGIQTSIETGLKNTVESMTTKLEGSFKTTPSGGGND